MPAPPPAARPAARGRLRLARRAGRARAAAGGRAAAVRPVGGAALREAGAGRGGAAAAGGRPARRGQDAHRRPAGGAAGMAGTAPVVVTADGKRAGAAEQLAAFTRLLGLQLLVASAPAALARALARREDGAPVLIDTPGSDPFDPAQRDEIAALAGTAGAALAVVLPAGLDVAEADRPGRRLRRLRRAAAGGDPAGPGAAHRRGAGRRRRRAGAGRGRHRPRRRRRPRAHDPRPAGHTADAHAPASRRPHRSAPAMTAATTIVSPATDPAAAPGPRRPHPGGRLRQGRGGQNLVRHHAGARPGARRRAGAAVRRRSRPGQCRHPARPDAGARPRLGGGRADRPGRGGAAARGRLRHPGRALRVGRAVAARPGRAGSAAGGAAPGVRPARPRGARPRRRARPQRAPHGRLRRHAAGGGDRGADQPDRCLCRAEAACRRRARRARRGWW